MDFRILDRGRTVDDDIVARLRLGGIDTLFGGVGTVVFGAFSRVLEDLVGARDQLELVDVRRVRMIRVIKLREMTIGFLHDRAFAERIDLQNSVKVYKIFVVFHRCPHSGACSRPILK